MKQALVSICIPVYNGADCITKCIESCLAQTYPHIEIIINDDGSTDHSLAIITDLAAKNERIKIHSNSSNIGLVDNWNKILTYANGDYIKWLFQDDWMASDAIEQFVNIAQNGYDFVISKRNFVLNEQASEEEKMYYQMHVKKLENHFLSTETGHFFSTRDIAKLATNYIALNFIAEPSLIFYKRSLVNKIGEYDNRFLQICDLEYNMRIASEAGVYLINKPLCFFAIHGLSTTKQNISGKFFRLRYIEQALYAYKLVNDNLFAKIQLHFSVIQKMKLKIYYKYRIHEAGKYIASHPEKQLLKRQMDYFPFLVLSTIEKIVYFPLFLTIDLIKSRL